MEQRHTRTPKTAPQQRPLDLHSQLSDCIVQHDDSSPVDLPIVKDAFYQLEKNLPIPQMCQTIDLAVGCTERKERDGGMSGNVCRV